MIILVEPAEFLPSLSGALAKSLHHYRIYFDEAGCLDVIAEEFVP